MEIQEAAIMKTDKLGRGSRLSRPIARDAAIVAWLREAREILNQRGNVRSGAALDVVTAALRHRESPAFVLQRLVLLTPRQPDDL